MVAAFEFCFYSNYTKRKKQTASLCSGLVFMQSIHAGPGEGEQSFPPVLRHLVGIKSFTAVLDPQFTMGRSGQRMIFIRVLSENGKMGNVVLETNICPQPMPGVPFSGLVKQQFSIQCSKRKFGNTTLPIPLSTAATAWGVFVWCDAFGHYESWWEVSEPFASRSS